jgi:hypothetical protein
MRRREKPKPVLAPGERPPCGYISFYGDGDCECTDRPYQHTHGCACGLPYSEHERYRQIWRAMAVTEVDAEVIRKTSIVRWRTGSR